MIVLKHIRSTENKILLLFFVLTFFELLAELFFIVPILIVFKILTAVAFLFLYFSISKKRNYLFFVAFFLIGIAKLLAIQNSAAMLFFGMLVFLIHRLVMIYYVAKLIEIRDYIPLLIAMIPFLLIFFYLLFVTDEIALPNYILLIVQNIFMAVLAGMTVSHFVMNDHKNNVWLLFFGMISVMQYFVVFLEKIYLVGLMPTISIRIITVMLTAFVNFTFYKFVIETERLHQN